MREISIRLERQKDTKKERKLVTEKTQILNTYLDLQALT